jgi:cyclase
MVNRCVIVARIKPGSEQQVAAIFAESDASDLPKLAGVRHRSLFVLEDLYIHLIETEDDCARSIGGVCEHPLFKEISNKLRPFIEPFNPVTWRSPHDAMAQAFYHWDSH